MITRLPTPHSYSKAVMAGDYVFLGLHRGGGDEFADQLRRALRHLGETLQECGLKLEHLVKVNVYLKRIGDLPEMEKLFLEFFEPGGYPARMTSTTEFIDEDCLVMLEGTAYKG
ncbi:RidA family protein [Gorillibacterium sp. sgz5001074]|uniref:RidA family protein n=1 Tax=Gorillibacterium sp. sgz5001074 TaxID=3446695 RepID=UPI003F6681C7